LRIICVLEFLVRSISRFLVRSALACLREQRVKFTREELLEAGFSSPDDDVPLGMLLKRHLQEKDRKMTTEEKEHFEQEQHEVVVEMVVEPPKKRARVVKKIQNRCEFRGNKTRCSNQIAPGIRDFCAKHGVVDATDKLLAKIKRRGDKKRRAEATQARRYARWCTSRDSHRIIWKIQCHARKMRVKEWVNYHKERFANERATKRFKELMGL
jgi:hypothetical protein